MMQVEQSYSPFEMVVEEISEWHKRPHKHNFFELVLIEEGEGLQCINQNHFPYRKNNIFLLPPLDCHAFQVSAPSRFVFLRFTNQVFHKQKAGDLDFEDWFKKAAYILINYNRLPGDIIKNTSDKEHLIHCIELVKHEYGKRDKYSDTIIQTTLVTILNMLTRNIEAAFVSKGEEAGHYRFGEVLNYIQHHLFDSESLKIANLAQEFAISPTYFSEYFRRNAGDSLQDYIIKSRLKIAEARLLYSENSVKEISYELGFSDISHFSRTFKKHQGYTIQEFKKKKAFSMLVN